MNSFGISFTLFHFALFVSESNHAQGGTIGDKTIRTLASKDIDPVVGNLEDYTIYDVLVFLVLYRRKQREPILKSWMKKGF